MKQDFEIFKKISKEANSGLLKYRTKQQIDSIYNWGNQQIEKTTTYNSITLFVQFRNLKAVYIMRSICQKNIKSLK